MPELNGEIDQYTVTKMTHEERDPHWHFRGVLSFQRDIRNQIIVRDYKQWKELNEQKLQVKME